MAKAAKVSTTTEQTETALAVVDNDTGEIVNDKLAVIDVSSPDIKKALESITKAKDTDFEESVRDFWDPQKKESDPRVLQGLYLGYELSAKMRIHRMLVPHPTRKGQVMIMRFKGTRVLSHLLEGAPEGVKTPGCRIEFQGEAKTSEGNRLLNWDVRWAPANG